MSPSAVVTAPPRTRPAPRAIPRRALAPADRPARHLRVVAADRRLRRVPRSVVLAAAGTVVALLALVVVHVMLAQSQLTLDRLNAGVNTAQRHAEQARLAHAQLAAPSHIVARAAQLGLVPAQPPVPIPAPPSTSLPQGTTVAPTAARQP